MKERGRLLRVSQVAVRLTLSEARVRQMLNQGIIQGMRLSERGWRVSEAALQEYLDRMAVM